MGAELSTCSPCDYCGKRTRELCPMCLNRSYCSKQCMKKDSINHKQICKEIVKLHQMKDPFLLYHCVQLDPSGLLHWTLVRTFKFYALYVRKMGFEGLCKAFIRTCIVHRPHYVATYCRLPARLLHSIDDKPAFICNYKKPPIINDVFYGENKFWCKYNKYHRDNGPAIIEENGNQYWCKNDLLYRDDNLPMMVTCYNDQIWFKDNMRYRGDDGYRRKPWRYLDIEQNDHWCLYMQVHRDYDQPAIIKANGDKYWFQDGVLRRNNGKPAVIKADFKK